jgi:hypothetical protein
MNRQDTTRRSLRDALFQLGQPELDVGLQRVRQDPGRDGRA